MVLPFLFGEGTNAMWDWGFIYVTLRFVLLPPACVGFLVFALFVSVRSKNARLPQRWITVGLAFVPSLILVTVYSWKNPMPP
jgi:hypothetical protein